MPPPLRLRFLHAGIVLRSKIIKRRTAIFFIISTILIKKNHFFPCIFAAMEIFEIIKALLTDTKHYLETFVALHGTLIYALLFLIVFCETGLVFLPLLPGDSLLFTAGVLAANPNNNLNVWLIIILLIIAALLGDNTNYFVGKFLGTYVKQKKKLLFLKSEHIVKTENYYEKYGAKTVIIARFIPIVRTVAPFVAGAGSMAYSKYITNCILGAILWVAGVTLLGYALGNVPFIQNNYELVILSIIGISLLPIVFEVFKSKFVKK